MSSTDLYISVVRTPAKMSFSFERYMLSLGGMCLKLTVTAWFMNTFA